MLKYIRVIQQLPWQLLFGILIPLLSVAVFVYSVSSVLRSLLQNNSARGKFAQNLIDLEKSR